MTTAPQDGTIDLLRYDAMLFDLDGVITDTARVHAAAWAALFDEFLREHAAAGGEPVAPFDLATDYPQLIDGRRRLDGVRAFLTSRRLALPEGSPDDRPDARTVAGLGRRKDRWFNEALDRDGVQVFDDAVFLVDALRRHGRALAVVTASENGRRVLERAGLDHLFEVYVTGVEARRLGLAGKPRPDTFLEAARRLAVPPATAVVFEDALAGVEAGRAGGFGLVVGVDRTGAAAALAEHGADVVTDDLSRLAP
jgi:beta-phosphoglucomutase family hydrolase